MKNVVDRVVQYPHRYQLKNVLTGEILGTFDLDPILGTVQVEGTKIDKELFDSISKDLIDIKKINDTEVDDGTGLPSANLKIGGIFFEKINGGA